MSNPLFRESALQSLSSPEQLDQLIKITQPRSWIALISIGFILVATILWSIFGSLPTNLQGAGMIVKKEGNFNVVALSNGVITDLVDLKVGGIVSKDQIIGHIGQPDLEQKIVAAKANLSLLERENASILAEIRQHEPAKNNSIKQQIDIQQSIITANEAALAAQNRALQLQESLLKDGLIVQSQYDETLQNVFGAQNKIDTAKNTLQSLVIETITNKSNYQDIIRKSETALLQSRNELKNLQVQYELATKLISPFDGVVIEKLALNGDVVNSNQAVLTLESSHTDYEVILFMPVLVSGNGTKVRRINPGMEVQVAINSRQKERYGYLKGRVRSISKYSSTEQGMTAVLKNIDVVNAMKASGPVFSVNVELLPDKNTSSGYEWSSKAGSPIVITSGAYCTGLITIENEKPINLILPLLKTMAGL